MKPRLAFIGTGWIGLNRMKAVKNICQPVAVFDTDQESISRAMAIAPEAAVVTSISEVLNMGPEGAVIATPSALHASQCIELLQKGLPVFCQKPLARTAEETERIISAAYNANRMLGVDMSYRYTDGMQKIRSITATQGLGRIFAVDLLFNNAYGPGRSWFYDPVLSGGGCLIDLGVHLIDLALWILGFPETVRTSSTLFSKGSIIEEDDPDTVEDYVSAQFETTTGTVIRLACSWNLSAGQDAEIRASFYGTNASAVFRNVNGSFYDFEAALCQGTSQKVLSSPPDDWGGRALAAWINDLKMGPDFREQASVYYKTAEVIDKIYRRKVTQKPQYESTHDIR
jgi:predicted dehydrogenase